MKPEKNLRFHFNETHSKGIVMYFLPYYLSKSVSYITLNQPEDKFVSEKLDCWDGKLGWIGLTVACLPAPCPPLDLCPERDHWVKQNSVKPLNVLLPFNKDEWSLKQNSQMLFFTYVSTCTISDKSLLKIYQVTNKDYFHWLRCQK